MALCLEKAYSRVHIEIVYLCLRKRGIPEGLVDIVKDIYSSNSKLWLVLYKEDFEIKLGCTKSQHSAHFFLRWRLVSSVQVLDERSNGNSFMQTTLLCQLQWQNSNVIVEVCRECLENGELKLHVCKTEILNTNRTVMEVTRINGSVINGMLQLLSLSIIDYGAHDSISGQSNRYLHPTRQ